MLNNTIYHLLYFINKNNPNYDKNNFSHPGYVLIVFGNDWNVYFKIKK